MTRAIFYKWDRSPFADKTQNALVLKGIPYDLVQLPKTFPRPALSDHLGISYRCIPVVAIGNDVYCDTSVITAALERRFPETQGYGTLFPPIIDENATNSTKDTGLIKPFAKYYIEAVLVSIFGVYGPVPIDPEAVAAAAALRASKFSSHLTFVEEQLSDGREYLFRTTGPSLADSTLQAFCSWAQAERNANDVFNSPHFPLANKWLERVTLHIAAQKASLPKPEILSDAAAAKVIIDGAHEPYGVIGFDQREAARLNVQQGGEVKVAPEGMGRKHPTTGILVALNREELILEVRPKLYPDSIVRVHFPRLGFTVTPVNAQVQSRL